MTSALRLVISASRNRGLWPEFKANGKANGGRHAKRIVKTYSSELESGGEHYQVVRFPSRHHIA